MIPADRTWFARIGAAAVIAHALIDIDPQYPTLGDDALRDLRAARPSSNRRHPTGRLPILKDRETRTPVGTLAQKQR